MDVPTLLARISKYILNPVITLGFIVATIVFFYGIVQFIWGADEDKTRDDGKRSIVWGIVGLVVMFSVYGIIKFVLYTFGLQDTYDKTGLPG
jgi:hypothetical protein